MSYSIPYITSTTRILACDYRAALSWMPSAPSAHSLSTVEKSARSKGGHPERSEGSAFLARPRRRLKFFHREIGVRIDANLAGDAHRFHSHVFERELRVFRQRPRRRKRVRPTRTDGHDAIIRLDHVAIARKNKCALRIRHNQQRFQVPQRAIFAPVLGQLHSRLLQIARKFL